MLQLVPRSITCLNPHGKPFVYVGRTLPGLSNFSGVNQS
ncbi:unnamed protein product [Larinioides sclopetarius]|uniref:Uncharacterized protein n=1 Tax=Larinioides sclopetarius TaxID=280406 RepID=A0AAV2AHT4_9ARAC